MNQEVHCNPSVRHEFVLLFDAKNCNPNGDPDAGNLPRVDGETMHGLVTDVAIKRRIRDFVNMVYGSSGESRYKIYIENKIALNALHSRAYEGIGQKPSKKISPELADSLSKWMAQNFYDIRMFGAVMSSEINAGQVRGPMQITFSESVHPIEPTQMAITRKAVNREDQLGEGSEGNKGKIGEMGSKTYIPYGLYCAHGFYNPFLGEQLGVTADDMRIFWQALVSMWDFTRSSSKGDMSCRGLYVFSHDSKLGRCPAFKSFERVVVKLDEEVSVPRSFGDFRIHLIEDDLPEGITITRLA